MALLAYATINGLEAAYATAVASAVNSGTTSNQAFGPPQGFYSSINNYTRLMYDPGEDAIVITHNAVGQSPHFIVPNFYVSNYSSKANSQGFNRLPETMMAFDARKFSPAGSGGVATITAKGASVYYMPAEGGATGLSYDPNSRNLRQAYWHYLAATLRGGGTTLPYGYGTTRMLSVTYSAFIPGWTGATWDGLVMGEQMLPSNYVNEVGAKGWLWFAPAWPWIPLPPITFDDVSVMAHSDRTGHSWLGCWLRPATTANSWRGSHSMPFGWPMSISPYSPDRCIAVWWSYPVYGAPLVYTIHRYDRVLSRLRLEDLGEVPTTRRYGYPQHVGFCTYDMQRGHLIFLSDNPDSLDQYTVQNYCHPGNPTSATAATALDPTHAGETQRYIAATMTGQTLLGAQAVAVSYTSFAASNFSRTATQFATTGTTGQGTFTVSWASGTSGVSGTLTMAVSTYSVGISATYSHGAVYGTEAMALLTSTGTFTVSSTLLAPSTGAASAVAGVTILARVPVSQADTIGHGSPRLLSYPTSALASPLFYGPPPAWTNILNQVLSRPLYASTKTLNTTAHAQFPGSMGDIAIEEIWPGGGNRIAMALSTFAALWDYFYNVPDLASAGFVTWSPRDITSRSWKVLITSLTVGGSDVEMTNLIKAGDGWVHNEVRMKLRLIEEV